MTGRAAGFCAGSGQPGFADPVAGRGFGRGRGFRNMFFATGLPGWARWGGVGTVGAADEKQVLASQAETLRTQLNRIQKRLDQLDSGAAAGS